MILGIPDNGVLTAYILLILTVALCTCYGIINWNSDGEISEKEIADENIWIQDEVELEEKLAGGF